MGSCNSKVNSLSWTCDSCGLNNRNNIVCSNCSSNSPKDIHDGIVAECKKLLQKYNQSHILNHINDITNRIDLNRLILQIYSIDFQYVDKLYKRAMNEEKQSNNNKNISPFPHSDACDISSIGDIDRLCDLGLKAIIEGKCCVVILAGGQGSRLGFNKPKGGYPIGSISNKSIYQLQIEKMLAIKRIACKSQNVQMNVQNVKFPMYFMTSDATHDDTKHFLNQHEYFKYDPNDIKLFKQMLHPCLIESNGKFIMSSASKIAMNPNGNGGIYSSLKQSGIFQDMIDRGIEYIQIFGIDNILCRIGDPLWFGHMIETNADVSNKTCIKTEPHEKVGVMCLKNGKPAVTEYTELTKDMVELRRHNNCNKHVETPIGNGIIIDSTDKYYTIEMDPMITSIKKTQCKIIKDDITNDLLEYCYGNLAMHQFSMRFLERICNDEQGIKYPLPIHIARKKIPFYDSKETKQTIKPESNNGIKLEYFVFDTFKYSEKCTVYNINRDEEFAPVKNPNGNSSPVSARIAHSNYWKQEIIKNGGTFENDDKEDNLLEVSPLFSYLPYGNKKEFKQRVNGKTFKLPIYLDL